MPPIGPERWPQIGQTLRSPLIAAVLWVVAATCATAAGRDERGQIAPANRRKLWLAQTILAVLGLSAWLRAGFSGARRFGFTMEEASIAGGLAGAAGAVLALLARMTIQASATRARPALTALLLAPLVAGIGYIAGAALAAIGAFLERRVSHD
jgi:small neutral amino acid transporter SnatA (MarC family)